MGCRLLFCCCKILLEELVDEGDVLDLLHELTNTESFQLVSQQNVAIQTL